MTTTASNLDVFFREVAEKAHAQSAKSGFWDHDLGCGGSGLRAPPGTVLGGETGKDLGNGGEPCACINLSLPMKFALINSEISEALEEFRLSEAQRGGPLGAILYACPGMGERKLSDVRHGEFFGAGICPRITITSRGEPGPHKPEGFVVELADVVIRLGDLSGRLGSSFIAGVLEWLKYAQNHYNNDNYSVPPMGDALSGLHQDVSAMYKWYSEHGGREGAIGPQNAENVARLVFNCVCIAASVDGDLIEAVKIKMAYNATRARMGKAC